MATTFLVTVALSGLTLAARQALIFSRQRSADIASGKIIRPFLHGGFEKKMSKREAAQILNIPITSDKNKVKDAYQKAIARNHPDRGGSSYIASKINEAKTLLSK
eukprot:TRINITY_DN5234_c0_g1_i1.p1 TRINITY_DN5234_c0_g1~~TRINITY_DN5234_c0_g1_i1.p1  ORF type:complete len:105 (-),score=24.19 TRINITY_DN5234_c0_g1_i1:89-403(-)